MISGATKLGVLNKKAGKALEMINWMRNHASPAHASDHKVENTDVVALVLILENNLFIKEMPDPGQSPSGLFDPIKNNVIDSDNLDVLREQIKLYSQANIRITFGFMLDIICKGENPAFNNVENLFDTVWEKANEDLKRTAGERYNSLLTSSSSENVVDRDASIRLLEALVRVEGIKYIPDSARAVIYRRAVRQLAIAKNTEYGWSDENKAARSLAQFGPYVPSIAFESVYQEILAVWCGNYWGRSVAYHTLKPFIDSLDSRQLMKLARMFQDNDRVQEELFQKNPRTHAINLLDSIKTKLTISSNQDEIDEIIAYLEEL